MTVAIVPQKISSVEFVPCAEKIYVSWDLYNRIKNTYNMIKNLGDIDTIYNNGDTNPYYHYYPSLIPKVTKLAIIKDPQICREAFNYYRNDKEGLFYLKTATVLTFFQKIYPKIDRESNILVCSNKNAIKLHSFLVSYFSTNKIQHSNIQAIVDETMIDWSHKEIIDLSEETKIFTASVIGKLFLGYGGSYRELTKAIDEVFKNIGLNSIIKKLTHTFTKWIYKETEYTKDQIKLAEAINVIKGAISSLIDPEDPNQDNICTQMRKKISDEGERVFSDEEIISMILVLFIAGQDTTANLLNYILMQLAKDPQLQENILNEVIPIKNVIAEGIRMFTPASLIGRQTGKDLKMIVNFEDGESESWNVPKETFLVLAPTFMARDENVVNSDSLNEFNPYRWGDKENIPSLVSLPWFPFGSKKHLCPGWKLAERENELFIKTLIKDYQLAIVNPSELRQRTNFVNKLEGDLRIQLTKREQ